MCLRCCCLSRYATISTSDHHEQSWQEKLLSTAPPLLTGSLMILAPPLSGQTGQLVQCLVGQGLGPGQGGSSTEWGGRSVRMLRQS